MPDIKQRAHKMFDERFPNLYDESDDYKGELGFWMNNNIKSFIDEIIDMVVAERDNEIVELGQAIPLELKMENRKCKLYIDKYKTIYGYDVWRGHYKGAGRSSGGFQNINQTMQSIKEVADRMLDEGWEIIG